MFIVSGLVSVAFGIVLFARPNVGAVTLALLFGLYFMIYGFSQIAAGVQVRQLGNAVRPLSPRAESSLSADPRTRAPGPASRRRNGRPPSLATYRRLG